VRNASDEPVYDVEIALWDDFAGVGVGRKLELPVLGSRTTRTLALPAEALVYREPIPGFAPEDTQDVLEFAVDPELTFVDRAGRGGCATRGDSSLSRTLGFVAPYCARLCGVRGERLEGLSDGRKCTCP
jgi:hypothetical protein